jgi:hypothetical protein
MMADRILPPATMLKWALSLFLVVLVIGLFQPRLTARLRLGRLPGDMRFRLRGRDYTFPFTTTLLLSLLTILLFRLL